MTDVIFNHNYPWIGKNNKLLRTRHFVTIQYGLLYNWFVISDSRNLTASGWHVSSDSEWETLLTLLGGVSVAGGKLKQTGTTYWNTPNTGATNEVGFNGRGCSFRYGDVDHGPFANFLKQYSVFHTSTEIDSTHTYNRGLYYSNATVFRNSGTLKQYGYAIRLIKDSTTLTHGQSGIYIGNDEKLYRTICIGTQEWVADNLAETKYRNGDLIPEVTADATWAALTTGALCAYGNNWNNV